MKLKYTSLPKLKFAAVTCAGAGVVMVLFAAACLPTPGVAGTGSTNTAATSSVPAGSCGNSASGFCNEFTGSSYKVERVKKSCREGNGVKYLAGACPTEGRIGTCTVYKGKNSESKYRYYVNFPGFGIKPAGSAAVAAQNQCTKLKGEWIPN